MTGLGGWVCAVFFDYHNAFDSVRHRPLIEKLRALGLDDYWITSLTEPELLLWME